MRLLGAQVVPVTTGTATLKDAVSEAMRAWTARVQDTHYCLGSCMGPHPFPTIVRDFQAVISREIKAQMLEREGRLPDAVLACVGGGSNAIGSFYHFIGDPSVRLIGCEAAGRGVDTPETAATIATGRLGIFHGMKSYFCQDQYGQIAPVYSLSAGLDYPGIGPEHAHLHDTGRAQYVPVTDQEAVEAFEYLARTEGIIPAIESAPRGGLCPEAGPHHGEGTEHRCHPLRAGGQGLRGHRPLSRGGPPRCMIESKLPLPRGRPSSPSSPVGTLTWRPPLPPSGLWRPTGRTLSSWAFPSPTPTAEGPVIQEANLRALRGGVTTDQVFALVQDLRRDVTVPLVFMTYANVVFTYGAEAFFARCQSVGVDGIILPDLPYEEKGEFQAACRKHGVALISMIAPTSAGRIAKIAREAEGFLYLVSSLGVTGVRQAITTDLAAILQVIRENTDLPCAIGFGISTPDQARQMAALADGAIVGSAIVKKMAAHGEGPPPM